MMTIIIIIVIIVIIVIIIIIMILIMTLSATFPSSSIRWLFDYKLSSNSLGVFPRRILCRCVPPGGARETHLLSQAGLAGFKVQCALIERTKNLNNDDRQHF